MRFNSEKATKKRKMRMIATPIILILFAVIVAVIAFFVVGQKEKSDPFAGRPPADMSEYFKNFEESDTAAGDAMDQPETAADDAMDQPETAAGDASASPGADYFVDIDVKEISKLKNSGETFVFIASYEDCGYCRRLIPYLAQVAKEKDRKIGYLNTRKDPSWESNVDIDDYDLFVDMFNGYLTEEASGYHLYTPDVYFIRNGGVVDNHKGVVEDMDDPDDSLTSTQEETLLDELRAAFDKLD